MKKKSHWKITSYALSENLTPSKRFFIKLGCIMPDILLYTFKRGHYYTTTKDRVLHRLDKLTSSNEHTYLECFEFGYNLHFVEDYFTYPHNFPYWKNRKIHSSYEAELQEELPYFLSTYINTPIQTTENPSALIEKMHIMYRERAGTITTDLSFMVPLVEHLVILFRNDANLN